MKTILLLGGSAQQVVAITKSKELGYRTVLCDYLPDNPGKDVADVFYLVSTTDKEAILEVAQKEHVDGVVAYASDPAAPTAAYVAEKMGLATNPYKSVEILSHKDLFRRHLINNGFNCPKSYTFQKNDFSISKLNDFKFPLIVKPIDSSGSKGISVVENEDNILNAVKNAFSYSREKKVIIEEYIQKNHKYQIGGDVFVVDGSIVLWGLLNCHRNLKGNILVPTGKSYPLLLDDQSVEKVKNELSRLLASLSISMGAFNIEVILDERGDVYLIEVGPRNGGNMIPDLLQMITDTDVVVATIQSAMGAEEISITDSKEEGCYATHNIHSLKNGLFKSIEIDEELSSHIIQKNIYKKTGDSVEYFSDASKALGILFLNFDTSEEQEKILDGITELYEVILEK